MVDSSRQPQDRNLVLSIQSVIDRWEILRIATKSTVYDSADEIIVIDRLALVCSLADCVEAPCKAMVDSSRQTK